MHFILEMRSKKQKVMLRSGPLKSTNIPVNSKFTTNQNSAVTTSISPAFHIFDKVTYHVPVLRVM